MVLVPARPQNISLPILKRAANLETSLHNFYICYYNSMKLHYIHRQGQCAGASKSDISTSHS